MILIQLILGEGASKPSSACSEHKPGGDIEDVTHFLGDMQVAPDALLLDIKLRSFDIKPAEQGCYFIIYINFLVQEQAVRL